MKSNFKKVVGDKDVDHLSLGYDKKAGCSIFIRMYGDKVATKYSFDNIEDMFEWLQNEADTTSVVKNPLPLPPMPPLPGV